MLGGAPEGLGAEDLRVLVVERRLEGGGRDVAVEHALVLVVEDRRLDPAAEQRLGLAHEVLVERVLARDQDGEPVAAAAGSSPLLAQARDRAGEADRDHRVERSDVDAELERIRRAHAEQLALRRAAARSRVAARACSRRGRARGREASPSRSAVNLWISSAARRLLAKTSVRRPRSTRSAISFEASASALAR